MSKLFGSLLIFSLVLIHENDAFRGRNSFEDRVKNCERLCGWPRLPQLPPRPTLPAAFPTLPADFPTLPEGFPTLPAGFPTLPPARPLGPSRNDNKKCLVLLDHNNATVTLCGAHCLERAKRESLGRTVDCECRNRQCIPSNNQTTAPAAATPTSTTPTPSSTGPTTPASTTLSSTTPSSTTPSSTTPSSTTPAPTTP